MERYVDRPTQMGARVLINDGWYDILISPNQLQSGMSINIQRSRCPGCCQIRNATLGRIDIQDSQIS